MPVESLFPRLEALLPLVQKPIQYVGGELNAQTKDWDSCDVRWAVVRTLGSFRALNESLRNRAPELNLAQHR